MKNIPQIIRGCIAPQNIVAAISLGLLIAPAAAQTDGTYITPSVASPSWDDSARWLDGNIPSGAGATATIHEPQTGTTRTFTFPTDRTIGFLDIDFNRTVASNNLNYIFSSGGATALTFDGNGSNAGILINNGNAGTTTTTINIPLLLGSSLDVQNNAGLLTINGGVSSSNAGLKTISNFGTIASGETSVIIDGVISDGSGSVAVLQNSATSWLELSGSNTYTGGTEIQAGELIINDDASLGDGSSAVTLNGGTLSIESGIQTDAGRSFVFGAGGGTIEAVGFVNLNGVVSGNGEFVKAGANILSLNSNANTMSGDIRVDEGTLRIRGGDGSLGATANSVTFADGTALRVQNTGTFDNDLNASRTFTLTSGTVGFNTTTSAIISATIEGAGQLSKSGASSLTLNGTNTYSGGTLVEEGLLIVGDDVNLGNTSGGVTIDGGIFRAGSSFTSDAARSFTIGSSGGTIDTPGFLNIDGVVGGSSELTKTGASVMSLNNAANTHSGGITVEEGTLRIRRGDGSLGAASNGVTLQNGTIFRVQNFGSVVDTEIKDTRTFTLDSGTATFQTNTSVAVSSLIMGAGGLEKTESGSLTLNAANTFTGGTTVSEGSLFVNNVSGSGTGTGTVTIESGGLLGGSGTISGATTINSGAILAPGNSPGVLAFGDDLTLAGQSIFEVDGLARGTAYDGVDVSGALNYGGSLEVVFGVPSADGATYDLFNILSSNSGSFTSIALSGAYDTTLSNTAGTWTGADGDASFTFVQSTGDLSVSVVPEPAMIASLLGLAAFICVVIRQKKKVS